MLRNHSLTQEEEKNLRLQNEVIRGHRLTTLTDQITSPPPQFGRNGTLPPLDSGEMNGFPVVSNNQCNFTSSREENMPNPIEALCLERGKQ